MKEYITVCPCCNKPIKVTIDDSGNVSTVFFDVKNNYSYEEIQKIIRENGIEFG